MLVMVQPSRLIGDIVTHMLVLLLLLYCCHDHLMMTLPLCMDVYVALNAWEVLVRLLELLQLLCTFKRKQLEPLILP